MALIDSVVLHNTDPGHHKEYRMELHQEAKGYRVIKRWGPIGRASSQKVEDATSLGTARQIMSEMQRKKEQGGYYVVSQPKPTAPPAQPTAPKPTAAPSPSAQSKPAAPKKSDEAKQMHAALKKLKPAPIPAAQPFVEGEIVEDDVAW